MGYSIYLGSLWAYQTHRTNAFVIVAGAILGFTAAMLWAAQGAIMMSYPMEVRFNTKAQSAGFSDTLQKDKGRSFSLFWTVFSLGGVLGGAITLGIEYKSKLSAVSTGVYLVFLIIMLTAIVTSWLILPPNLVVRKDGTLVELEASISMKQEAKEFFRLFTDYRMLLLFPMCFTSNYFYAYQGSIIAHYFNARSRALSSLLTNLGAVLGAIFIGVVLDKTPGNRRRRALTGLGCVLFLQLLVWSGGIGLQVQFKRTGPPMLRDWSDDKAWGTLLLLLSYYFADACYQGLAYYIIASLTNDSFRLARMAGFYKGIQSAGAAISFAMDAVKTPYLTELIVSWALILFSLPFALIVILKIKESNYGEEDTHHVEDLKASELGGAALPEGHHELHYDDTPKGAETAEIETASPVARV